METTIRTSEPRELLALIPYQLGFAPRESAVVVSIRARRSRVGLVARVDLADLADPGRGPQVARSLVGHLVADGARSVVLVVYTGAEGHGLAREARVHLAQASDHLLGEPASWVVGETGYRAMDCQDEECCPPRGRPLADLQATQIGAHMVLRGAQVVASREALGAIAPASPAARRSARRAAARWSAHLDAAVGSAALHRWRRDGLTLWRGEVAKVGRAPGAREGWDEGLGAGADEPAEPVGVDATVMGRLQAALSDVLVRDAVMLGFIEGTDRVADRVVAGYAGPEVSAALRAIVDPAEGQAPDPQLHAAARTVLEDVVAHSVRHAQAPALTLLGVLAWWDGDGARAAVLLERALVASPGYRLAELLDQTLAAGMPPGWLRTKGA